jgi:hypothetical protein
MGSSIVRNAFLHARHTYEGPNLSMKRYGYTILWQDKGDLKWQDLVPRLVFLSNLESPPSVLVVHCGGNSIDQTPLFDLRAEINFSLNQIKVMFPETKLVWSQILPRSNWRKHVVIGNDCTCSCKFNYHTITTAQVQLR